MPILLAMLGWLVFFIAIAALVVKIRKRKFQNYRRSLAALARDPSNITLRQNALALGRIYYAELNAGRNKRMDNETAIQNDILAVTKGV